MLEVAALAPCSVRAIAGLAGQARSGAEQWRAVRSRRRFGDGHMKGDAAAIGWNAGLIERTLQLRLVAQQQGQCFLPLHGDLDPRWRILRTLDANLHLTQLRRIEPQGEPLRSVRCMSQ